MDLCYNYMQERLQNIFFKGQLEKLTEKEKEIAKVSRRFIVQDQLIKFT